MVEFNPTKLNRTDIVPVKHNSWGWDWVMLLDIFLNKVQSTIEQVTHSGHRKGEKEILSAASGPGVSVSRQFLDGWAQRQCPACSGEGLAVLPGLRTPFLRCSSLLTLPLLLTGTWRPHTDLHAELHIHVHFSTEGFCLYLDVISWLDQEKRGRGQKGLSESQVHVDPRSWVLCGEETAQGAKRTSHISYRVFSGKGLTALTSWQASAGVSLWECPNSLNILILILLTVYSLASERALSIIFGAKHSSSHVYFSLSPLLTFLDIKPSFYFCPFYS